MTPKEKAKELWWKFFGAQAKENEPFVADGETAVKCALIAVDELINSHLLLNTTHENEPSIRCKTYWQEVKQEIEKL